VRAVAIGATGVLLGLYLARMGFSEKSIGAVISAGLTGAAASAVVATFLGDRIGRRRLLLTLSLLGIAGLCGLAWSGTVALTAAFAFLGMVNGMGRDRGAALILEQAALPGFTRPEERTRAFAWYSMTSAMRSARSSPDCRHFWSTASIWTGRWRTGPRFPGSRRSGWSRSRRMRDSGIGSTSREEWEQWNGRV
jgi:MFS family permease